MNLPSSTADWATNDPALARLALACLDLTELGDACTHADVAALCAKAQGYLPGHTDALPALPPVAAVCVWPDFVAQARASLPEHIRVAAVVNFPSGDEPVDGVCGQVQQIRDGGGQEVDCVLPYRACMAGDVESARALVRAVRAASQGLSLKLIVESGAWTDATLLRAACDMALEEGVDFLKTSTGKMAQGASLAAADVLLSAAAAHPARERIGFKPSGGIRTLADVRLYAAAAQRHLGDTALVPARFRIGASGLWTDIARVLGQTLSAPAANLTY